MILFVVHLWFHLKNIDLCNRPHEQSSQGTGHTQDVTENIILA